MKCFSLLLAFFAVAQAKPTFSTSRALQMRGGGELGPIDADLAVKLSKAATTAYVAGAASKYISGQTGGSTVQLASKITEDGYARNALITAIACAMYGLGDTGFDTITLLALGNAAALGLTMLDSGFSTDTVMANKVQTAISLMMLYVAYA